MANLNEEERLRAGIRAAVKEMFKVPLELDMERMTLEQKHGLVLWARELGKALQAYYDQHQVNGCDCELCKNAEHAFATRAFVK